MQNNTHALNNEIVVNALAGVVGVGITYIKDDEDIIPLLKVASLTPFNDLWFRLAPRQLCHEIEGLQCSY